MLLSGFRSLCPDLSISVLRLWFLGALPMSLVHLSSFWALHLKHTHQAPLLEVKTAAYVPLEAGLSAAEPIWGWGAQTDQEQSPVCLHSSFILLILWMKVLTWVSHDPWWSFWLSRYLTSTCIAWVLWLSCPRNMHTCAVPTLMANCPLAQEYISGSSLGFLRPTHQLPWRRAAGSVPENVAPHSLGPWRCPSSCLVMHGWLTSNQFTLTPFPLQPTWL